MRTSDYSMHGFYKVYCRNQIMIAELKGGWNTDTAHAFCRDFKLEVEAINDKPWGHIVYLADWEMGTPGVDVIAKALVDWCIEHNLTHAAHVYEHETISHYYVDKIVTDSGKTFTKKVFDNDEDAYLWLELAGYTRE